MITIPKIKYSSMVLGALWLFMLLPDIIYGLFNNNYISGFDVKSISITLLLMCFLLLSRARRLNIALIFALALMQSTQLMYFQYFGGFYSAFDMILMLDESQDAFLAFMDVMAYMMIPLSISFTFAGFACFVYQRFQTKVITLPYISIVMVLLFSLPFLQSLGSEASQKYQPNIAHSSVKNGLYSMSFFGARQIKKALGLRKDMPTYKPYKIEKTIPVDANVIMLMGESLSYYNMELYGYKRKTTPDLMPYKEDPSFFYRPAISSAVSTRVSLALFFNTVYEPNNAAHVSKMDTALFRLAKKSGFNTHYITTQTNAGGLTYSFSLGDIDTWKENTHLSHYEGEYDNRLLLELKAMKLNFDQPQFVTLHMRSAHGPYVDNYPKDQEVYPVEGLAYEDYIKNSYDNSVIYTQKVIADIYQYFKDSGKPTYIFFTPDHGELMGQDGKYGHNSVDLDMARVPFMFYGVNLQNEKIKEIKANLGCMPNHYLISLEIARILGHKITNPNQEKGMYYLNGTDVFGEAGFMKYDLAKIQKETCPQFSAAYKLLP